MTSGFSRRMALSIAPPCKPLLMFQFRILNQSPLSNCVEKLPRKIPLSCRNGFMVITDINTRTLRPTHLIKYATPLLR